MLLKLHNWEELHWYLCILAHHDQATAREGGRRILIKFGKLPEEALHHRLTVHFCALGSPLRRQLQRFISGEKLTSLPELETAVSRLRFVPVTERSIERPHGILKKNITYRHHGPLSVAMSARAPEVERDFGSSETQFKSFAQHAEAAMSVRRIPHLLQLGGHPWLKPLSAGKFDSSRWVTILSHVIYRCDDISQFRPYKDARKKA